MSELVKPMPDEALLVPNPEAETVRLLCGSPTGWVAGPQIYDFLHRLAFFPDGTGLMESGGGQRLNLAVGFKYQLTPDGKIQFEYGDTTSRVWGTNYKASRVNPFKDVPYIVEKGPFNINGVYTRMTYEHVIKLGKSPFPKNAASHYGGNLFFKGDPNSDVRLNNFYGYLTEEIAHYKIAEANVKAALLSQ